VINVGEKNLKALLKSMQPTLLPGIYAFVTLPKGRALPAGVAPLMTFAEPEGTSLILSETDVAKTGLPHAFFCRGISLAVHSSLYAVGFLAAVSERLANAGMSINIASAYHRDYVFVPTARAEEAVELLRKVALEASR
jgi:hypothetical protein